MRLWLVGKVVVAQAFKDECVLELKSQAGRWSVSGIASARGLGGEHCSLR